MFNLNLSVSDIKKIIEEEKIQFIRLQFVDIFGSIKNIAITVQQLDKALNNEIMFDGSSIEGFVRIEESDMYLKPDLSSFVVLPWLEEFKIARMICDIYRPSGERFEGDPRYILQKAVEEAKEMGYDFFVGPECEFYIFQTDIEGAPTTKTYDKASYFDLAPIDKGEIARINIAKTLIEMGFQIEAAHHENGPGQHEIDFKYSDAVKTADNIITFKLAVKVIAKKYGFHATFMPKPLNNEAGSGMHCNMSLFKDGKNAFYDKNDSNGLSKEAYYFIGGILKHAKGMTAITNPLINSYKRLVAGFEAPIYIAWSPSNRSPLVRIPTARESGTRIELRHPDPSCNPYLALAIMLKAGLDGIKNKITPPDATNENIYKMMPKEIENCEIESLPKSLDESIIEMLNDSIITETLGSHILNNYVKAKSIEWDEYSKKVHSWETDKYLITY